MKTKSTDSQACGWFGVFTPFAGNPRLSEATWHQTPLTPFGSISHTTLGFEKALRIGYRGIRRQIDVRLSAQTPERLLRRVAAIQRLGGGIVAVYNDDRVIPSLVHFGYSIEEARNYANDGCWEILVPGKTSFGYQPFDALLLLQEALGLSATEPVARHEKVECDEWRTRQPEPGVMARFPDFGCADAAGVQRLYRNGGGDP